MEIAALIQLLLPILTTALSATGIIPSNLTTLISTSASTLATLVSQLISGNKTVTGSALIALQAVQSEIAALKAANVALFTLNEANEINALDSGITDAITAYQASQVKTDPSNLTPLPTSFPVSGPGVGQPA
jgi:hypothetical protein